MGFWKSVSKLVNPKTAGSVISGSSSNSNFINKITKVARVTSPDMADRRIANKTAAVLKQTPLGKKDPIMQRQYADTANGGTEPGQLQHQLGAGVAIAATVYTAGAATGGEAAAGGGTIIEGGTIGTGAAGVGGMSTAGGGMSTAGSMMANGSLAGYGGTLGSYGAGASYVAGGYGVMDAATAASLANNGNNAANPATPKTWQQAATDYATQKGGEYLAQLAIKKPGASAGLDPMQYQPIDGAATDKAGAGNEIGALPSALLIGGAAAALFFLAR